MSQHRMTKSDYPANQQHLLDAMKRTRDELGRAQVRISGPTYPALEMLKRAIDALATLLTGNSQHFWASAPGSSEQQRADLAERQEQECRLREREAECFREQMTREEAARKLLDE